MSSRGIWNAWEVTVESKVFTWATGRMEAPSPELGRLQSGVSSGEDACSFGRVNFEVSRTLVEMWSRQWCETGGGEKCLDWMNEFEMYRWCVKPWDERGPWRGWRTRDWAPGHIRVQGFERSSQGRLGGSVWWERMGERGVVSRRASVLT